MNLIEAIKSGRPFRRQSAGGKWFTPLADDQGLASSKDDILAEDWEIQEPKVEITRAQFWEAVEHARAVPSREPHTITDFCAVVAAKLGLGETGDSK